MFAENEDAAETEEKWTISTIQSTKLSNSNSELEMDSWTETQIDNRTDPKLESTYTSANSIAKNHINFNQYLSNSM